MANHMNVEIKARCRQPENIRQYLLAHGARFVGTDHQVDTYFNCNNGRLKLRQGNIENALIFYARNNQPGPKQADVNMMPVEDGASLKSILHDALGEVVVVNKRREIYFIDDVKFHIDEVQGLGSFMEIEAIDKDGVIGKQKLDEQCQYYLLELGIKQEDLQSHSYSDMLLHGQ